MRKDTTIPKLALSTMSCSKAKNSTECLEQIEALGSPPLELDFHLGEEPLKAILHEFDHGNIEIAGIHNCNPKFVGTRERYNFGLADLDENRRLQAVEDFKFSLELTARCQVEHCVGPLGRIEPPIKEEQLLRRLYRVEKDSDEFAKLRGEVIDVRASRVGPYLDAASRSVEELAAVCDCLGVKFVPENRYEFGKLGLPEEIRLLQDRFPDAIGYCHDFGHSMSVGCLGLWPDPDPLTPTLPVDVWHINDFKIDTLIDHLPLGEGDLSLDSVRKNVCSDGDIAVVEIRARHPRKNIKAALELVAGWLDDARCAAQLVSTMR